MLTIIYTQALLQMNYKQTILDALEVMRKKSIADKEMFKARAYSKVALQIKELPVVSCYEDLAGITGIGDKIRDKLDEIIATGTLATANRAKEAYHLDALDVFLKIYGVGPAKATEIIDAGIYTIADLRAEFTRLESVKNPPKYYNELTKVGLKYYEPLLERIPRAEMMQHRAFLGSKIPGELEYEIVGSFRRKATSSGDIDMLIKAPATLNKKKLTSLFNEYVASLEAAGYITDILALGDKKCMAICCIQPGKYRRLDLLITPESEYAYAILYFTGSDKFNIAFRQHALNRGYTLNEHALTPLRADVSIAPFMKTEKDIFAFLGLKYVAPENRVDGVQIIIL
jgi:DNA polymerase beta